MTKRLILSLLLCLLVLPAGARERAPRRKELLRRQALLQQTVDSLQRVVDSLRARKYLEDSTVLAVLEGNAPDSLRLPRTYDAALSDSLMDVWYRSHRVGMGERPERFDMDSVRFSSNVSDEEMMRRLKAMNAYITLPFNETVKNYMIFYSEKAPRAMARILGLCSYYMPLFEDIFSRYGLPLELKYMAVIESHLDPTATSRAGARGMWQFMYNTARAYGLKINSFVDERLDVEKAADAAARYLRDSYEVFGDWNLAISSYNCGAGNVQKAIRRAGSRAFWDIYPYLPRETRGYVPAFVGAMYAITYSKEYGLEPDDVGMPAVTDTFEIRKNLHFKQINEVVGVPMQTLRQLNPQYVHEIIPGGEQASILQLPFNWTPAFMSVDRDTLYNHKSGELLSEQVVRNIKESGAETRIAYRVKSGDYLGRIASRNHVTVSQLRKWNHLRSDRLRVGQILYIYRHGSGPEAKTATSAAKGKTAVPAKPAAKTETWSGHVLYTVQAGDSLYGIAKKYPGISAANIIEYNHLRGSSIRPGMKLKIPVR